ncbi:hypothetical protein EXU57_03040 [Segetibacter sp. 3557_3]|uniref:glycosyltransferase n=1 Tax=Segetibacter sp. 3557_3 TaxID=2547429 RepID=UPI001058D6A2|nr:hypothetical protein [Segetibacter sp. 3557_3]TDH29062.1 hypothetical protein EXU57_03040 [Segetibacter sp. 3557_3]
MNDVETKPLLLVFPFDVLAHYLRCLKLANYLSAYFEVRFLYSEKYQHFVRMEGYATFEGINLDADHIQDCVRRFDFSWINKNDLEKVYLNQVEIISTLRPAAVLADMSPTLKMAAESIGVPCVALMNSYLSRYYAQVHPMPKSHPLAGYIKLLPERMANYFIALGEQKSFKEIHQPFNQLRSKYGLSEQTSYQDEMEGDINLLCDLPELFPQKTLPANYFFVPPLYYDFPGDSSELLHQLDPERKTIFVTMGSTGNWQNGAFLNDPLFDNYNMIIAGDHNNFVTRPGVIKSNFVNIHDLFGVTDLVICHGGNGTIYQALLYALPVLCKTAHFEQEWNVRMLEQMKVGKSLDNVTSARAHVQLVDEWVGKKNSPVLIKLRHRLCESNNGFAEAIRKMVVATGIGTQLQAEEIKG